MSMYGSLVSHVCVFGYSYPTKVYGYVNVRETMYDIRNIHRNIRPFFVYIYLFVGSIIEITVHIWINGLKIYKYR